MAQPKRILLHNIRIIDANSLALRQQPHETTQVSVFLEFCAPSSLACGSCIYEFMIVASVPEHNPDIKKEGTRNRGIASLSNTKHFQKLLAKYAIEICCHMTIIAAREAEKDFRYQQIASMYTASKDKGRGEWIKGRQTVALTKWVSTAVLPFFSQLCPPLLHFVDVYHCLLKH